LRLQPTTSASRPKTTRLLAQKGTQTVREKARKWIAQLAPPDWHHKLVLRIAQGNPLAVSKNVDVFALRAKIIRGKKAASPVEKVQACCFLSLAEWSL